MLSVQTVEFKEFGLSSLTIIFIKPSLVFVENLSLVRLKIELRKLEKKMGLWVVIEK